MATLDNKFSFYFIFSIYLLLIFLSKRPIKVDSKHNNNNNNLMNGPLINITKQFSFPNFDPNKNSRILQDLNLLGNSRFSVQNSGSIQIPDPTTQTSDLKFQVGRAIYSSPVRLLDSVTQTPASFKTSFSFQFNNLSSSSSSNNEVSDSGEEEHGGSGLTFIIVPDELTIGRPGPWLGIMNDACNEDYKVIAVEFDTRKNVQFGDPNDNHVGINLGSIISTITVNASDFGVSLNDGSVHQAWISYDGKQRLLQIHLSSSSLNGSNLPPLKPIFSSKIDLLPYLNEYMFVGFSASTGNHTQIHNILSWNFSSISEAHLLIPSSETCEDKIIIDFNKTAHKKIPTSFLVFVAVVVLCLVVLLNFYCNSSKNRGGRGGDEKPTVIILPEENQRSRLPNKPRRFNISEILSSTRGFNEREVLSHDSRGVSYKGTLANGSQVMVTRFSTQFLNSPGLDRRRVMKEICAISRVRHPNLVSVRGWCFDNKEVIVVYHYIQNGSLDRWLFGIGVLPWTRRFKAIKDVADSLSFLHSKKFAHKNVKTSSVFLDITFRAVLGDFGFVFAPAESNRVEAVVSQKVDVFGFGILALEVVAGRSNSDSDVEGEKNTSLLDFAWRMHERDEMVKVVDKRMGPIYNSEQAFRVLKIGLLCTLNDSNSRPSMEEVVGFLDMDRSIPKLPARRPVALFPYNSATDLCIGYSCSPF